jgi:hypothetical protein
MRLNRILFFVIAALAIAACTVTVVPETPTPIAAVPPTPVTGEATATPSVGPPQATATLPPPSATMVSTVQPTAALTVTVSAPAGANLTNAEMATILHDSFAAFPWLLSFNVTSASATELISGTIEAQSDVRVETVIAQMVDTSRVTIDTIVISPTLYVKVSGLAAGLLQPLGLTPDQWAKITASQDTLSLTSIALAVADPAQLLANIGYGNLLNQANPSGKPFVFIGTERIEGVLTNVYELQITSGSTTTIIHVAVGVDDGRLYQLQSEGPQQIVITTMQYNASFTVQPPIP